MATMKGLCMLDIGKVGMVERDIPHAGPGEAIVKTTASLLCTSDVHTVAGLLGIPNGRLLGHESIGVVHEVGDGVTSAKVGDRVVVCAITPDGTCEACQRGFSSQCGGPLGGYRYTAQRDGNLSEYFYVNDANHNLAVIPDSVPDEKAVYCCDMMTTGFAGAENAKIPIGGSVVIFAQGAVGLCATIGAKLQGAGLIVTVDGMPERRELSSHFGADITLDPADPAVMETITEATGGGADSAIEALGHQATFENCIRVTKPGGTISNLGYHGESGPTLSIPLDAFALGMGDKSINTALCPGGNERMGRLLRLLETGKVDPTPMTTHTMPLDQSERAFHLMKTKEDGILKPLITY